MVRQQMQQGLTPMFSDFITDKGERALAVVFDVPRSTVRTWKRRNAIPRDRWPRLQEIYPEATLEVLVGYEIAALKAA